MDEPVFRRAMALGEDEIPIVPNGKLGRMTAEEIHALEEIDGSIYGVVLDGQDITARFLRGDDVEGWAEGQWGWPLRRKGDLIFVKRNAWRVDGD